ncbi:aspartate-alanine antiporter [Solitalea canadensis]|uniref:Aspartate-alanine antiporter n=1 Tax=Solitalea canadensis (strain ATCC 29591 / DSM 3403 / JCM 21819 / LMG 8368 / NBRC 15130 / NCIMB 12057 / USAM 9D) TaxID=929556 RepID=H8KMK1_SOLCM|nr:aspartate-alanine antiporter [Solitalea canadensis]AFD08992.1 aspartate-alanine antiporter [Solitalea canadensis DSM 3403]
METLQHIIKQAPEFAVFFSLALGHAVGRIKIGSFSLGAVASTLIFALLIGQLGVTLSPVFKAACFALFVYSIGFKSGPEFFGSLNRGTVKLLILAVVVCVTGLILVIGIGHALHLNKGLAAGLAAGALTESATMGTASDAINRLGLSADETQNLSSNMAVAFAITYVLGTITVIIFLRNIAPLLLKVNLKQAAKELEESLSGDQGKEISGSINPYSPVIARAYKLVFIPDSVKTTGDIEQLLGDRTSVFRIVHEGKIIDADRSTPVVKGDIVALMGNYTTIMNAEHIIGPEINHPEALRFTGKIVKVVLTNNKYHNRSIKEIAEGADPHELRGVFLVSIKRQDNDLPMFPYTQLRRGDVIQLMGDEEQVDRISERVGYVEKSSEKSDLVMLTAGIVAGILVGLLSVDVGGVPITLGVGGGCLVSGLFFGWLRSKYPVFGSLPGAAQWVLAEFGLSAFAAVVGLSAGPDAIDALHKSGPVLIILGILVALVPQMVGLFVGHKFLKLNPVILLGGLCGSQTVAAALSAISDEAESTTPVLGFTVTYAIGNVLLAIWGPIIVNLV